jgi:hypothetical protein
VLLGNGVRHCSQGNPNLLCSYLYRGGEESERKKDEKKPLPYIQAYTAFYSDQKPHQCRFYVNSKTPIYCDKKRYSKHEQIRLY